MTASSAKSWIATPIVVGLAYAVIGVGFGALARGPSGDVRTWRLAAWVTSAIIYAAHIAYERFSRRSSVPSAALHVATAAAIGAFGLAVAAMIHSARMRIAIALVAWPALVAIPAFVVAVAVGAMLRRGTFSASAAPPSRR